MSENKRQRTPLGPEHPEQAAALQQGGTEESERKNPQDGTESTFWDTSQHSDAPGPFGTG